MPDPCLSYFFNNNLSDFALSIITLNHSIRLVFFFILNLTIPGMDLGSFQFDPANLYKNGLTSIANKRNTETGLPGKQIIALFFINPNPNGLPGLMAIFQNLSIPIFFIVLSSLTNIGINIESQDLNFSFLLEVNFVVLVQLRKDFFLKIMLSAKPQLSR